MNVRHGFLTVALALPLSGLGLRAAEDDNQYPDPPKVTTPAKEFVTFGALHSPALDVARKQAHTWLKGAGKTDEASQKEFEAIWDAQQDRPVLERVTATLSLGDSEAAQLLTEARDEAAPAPTEVPAVLRDAKRPTYFRANLALAVARALSNRRVHEEALEVLKLVKPEQVVDPGAYYFHRAVAEHALLLRDEAVRSITAVIEDVGDAPDRYRLVSVLMLYDMQSWRDKDLGWIARKMDNIERRLELARGGPQTQKMEKEVVARLDELIKELENQNNGSSNGGGCPGGGSGQANGGSNQPSSPMKDSNIALNGGPGNEGSKRLKNLAEDWGKMPEKDRAKAMADLTRDLPPRHREVIEKYFKDLAKTKQQPNQP